MNTIKFRYRFKNMPHGVEYCETWVYGIKVVDLEDLSGEEVRQDTERIDGTFYRLDPGRYIVVELFTDCLPEPMRWRTIRRWTLDSDRYYRGLVGKIVKIEIVSDKKSV